MFKNERGQMAIFVALIFQILFVFFAMIINVGLIVHDKINLQNSVDLAAYYGAQKQAELLNSIAHTNYQIRQSWKLLAFRVRALGDMGRATNPVLAPNIAATDTPVYAAGERPPSTCLAFSFWAGQPPENLCQKARIDIQAIPKTPIIAPFLPWNPIGAMITEKARETYGQRCGEVGIMNWKLAVRWMAAYRMDIQSRVQVIDELSKRLATGPYFQELSGASVEEGIRETFQRNLTSSNRTAISSFQFFNSMQGMPRNAWLNKIAVKPRIFYTDSRGPASAQSSNSNCSLDVRPIDGRTQTENLPSFYSQQQRRYDPDGAFMNLRNDPPSVEDPAHPTVGFEKNPWVMTYVVVEARTKPRKPFAPFGKPITLVARAYAKPFGGRVGPWKFSQWPLGSNKSTGGQPIEPLYPVAFDPQNPATGFQDSEIPNYSRFPGDPLGLRSRLALSMLRRALILERKRISTNFWGRIPEDLAYQKGGDVLAWSVVPEENSSSGDPQNPGPWIRPYEVAAVSPDLFDIAYYSIEPNFLENYMKPALNRFGEGIQLRPDVGYHPPNLEYNIRRQIATAQKFVDPNLNYYILQDFQHLLTSWAPRTQNNYSFPEQAFGKCYDEGRVTSFGSCAVGGRVGYSVKLVSKDYLMQKDLPLGGSQNVGSIVNPPAF